MAKTRSRARAGGPPPGRGVVEWEQFEGSSLWEASATVDGREYALGVTDDDLGLHPGGRWYWSITQHGYPHGWSRDSGKGFRSRKAAMKDAEQYLFEWAARDSNPMAGMPGGSVKGCIQQVKKRKTPPRDAGAYCAAIADRIEPDWRDNPDIGHEKRRQYVFPTKESANQFAGLLKRRFRVRASVRQALPEHKHGSSPGVSVFFTPRSFGEMIEIASEIQRLGGRPWGERRNNPDVLNTRRLEVRRR